MKPYYEKQGVQIFNGDSLSVLRELPDQSVNCCVTSPPYWGLRDYGVDGQLGLEPTPEEYVEKMVSVFSEVKRVLRDDGTLWLNLGDSFYGSWANYGGGNRGAGKQRLIKHGSSAQNPAWEGLEDYRPAATHKHPVLKPKDLIGIPWRVALGLQADGWYLRQDIIWHKPNPMPESVTDRCTKSHEYIFLMSKSPKYYFDSDAISEPCVESNASRPRMGQGPNTQYKQKRRSQDWAGNYENLGSIQHGVSNAGKRTKRFGDDPEKRIKRSVWTVATQPYKQAHFATFPEKLIEPCILAGCPEGGTVLDPFYGSGTTGFVARKHGRKCVGIELNAEYCEIAVDRLRQGVFEFTESSKGAE